MTGAASPVRAHRLVTAPVPPDGVEPEALVATHWFDPGDDGAPYPARIRVSGRRIGSGAHLRPGDTFLQDESIETVIPGAGPVSITTWTYGLRPEEWTVTAELIGGPGSRRHFLSPATWSWRRWAVSPGPEIPVKTRWALLAPLARQPAVLPGSYPAMAFAGLMVALGLQAILLSRQAVDVGT